MSSPLPFCLLMDDGRLASKFSLFCLCFSKRGFSLCLSLFFLLSLFAEWNPVFRSAWILSVEIHRNPPNQICEGYWVCAAYRLYSLVGGPASVLEISDSYKLLCVSLDALLWFTAFCLRSFLLWKLSILVFYQQRSIIWDNVKELFVFFFSEVTLLSVELFGVDGCFCMFCPIAFVKKKILLSRHIHSLLCSKQIHTWGLFSASKLNGCLLHMHTSVSCCVNVYMIRLVSCTVVGGGGAGQGEV